MEDTLCTWRFKELGGRVMEDTLLQNPRTVQRGADWSPSRSGGDALEERLWMERPTFYTGDGLPG